MTSLLDTVRAFAYPRFPGTDGERRAADEVAARFAAAGLAVSREPIEVGRTAVRRYRKVIHGGGAALIVLAALIAPVAPVLAGLVAVALLVLLANAGRWPRVVEQGFDRPPFLVSENVIGRRPGRGSQPLRLIVLAHRDSKSARFPTFVPVMMIFFAALVTLLLAVRCLLGVTRGQEPPSLLLTLPPALLAAAALVRALHNPAGNESPGAMDNASGLAVLLESARTLPTEPALADAELTFLATGAEEIGLAGCVRWIQAHEAELARDRTVFVNLDSVGVGRGLIALRAHGFAPGGRPLKTVLRESARAAGIPLAVVPVLPGVGVDTMPLAARGFTCVTLLGRVLGAASRRIHSRRDTPEHLSEEALADAAALVREIALSVVRLAPR